jgi:hypothetical protein
MVRPGLDNNQGKRFRLGLFCFPRGNTAWKATCFSTSLAWAQGNLQRVARPSSGLGRAWSHCAQHAMGPGRCLVLFDFASHSGCPFFSLITDLVGASLSYCAARSIRSSRARVYPRAAARTAGAFADRPKSPRATAELVVEQEPAAESTGTWAVHTLRRVSKRPF